MLMAGVSRPTVLQSVQKRDCVNGGLDNGKRLIDRNSAFENRPLQG
jgi:hypothetical protein